MAPPAFTPFLNSDRKCQSLIGCRNRAGFFFCNAALTILIFTSLIRADACSKLTLSFSRTKQLTKLGLQGSTIVLSQVILLYINSQDDINCISAKLLFRGRSL